MKFLCWLKVSMSIISSLIFMRRGWMRIMMQLWWSLPHHHSLLSLKPFKLGYKSIIGVNNSSPWFYEIEGFLEVHIPIFDKISYNKTYWTRYSGKTVNHDISFLQHLKKPIGSFVEMNTEIITLVILCRDDVVMRYVSFWMIDFDSFSCGKECLYLMFLIM